jgi:hypothetical protein
MRQPLQEFAVADALHADGAAIADRRPSERRG